MRFKVLPITVLVLLGILIFSVHSGLNSNSFLGDKSIIKKIENNSSYFEVSEDWDGFETVTVDTDKLREDANEGNLTLKLMGEDFKIQIKEKARLQGENAYFYTGHVIGNKESRADLYVDGDFLSGSLELGEPRNITYNIATTNETYDERRVHVVFLIDWEKEIKRLEQKGIDPLQFSLINNDSRKHVISIELFDFNNKSTFKETYTINSGEVISSPKIDAELGEYRYQIILEKKLILEQKVRTGYAANLSSSEKLYIYITDDPDNPVTFGIVVA